MADVELEEGAAQQLSIGWGPRERSQASDGVACRRARPEVVGAGYAPSPSSVL
jgi:hypothetical protein